jgi:uncharacterized protein YoxC
VTTDERLDRLTEGHQALAESLQLLTLDVQGIVQSTKDLRESINGLTQSVKELRELGRDHDRILRGHADLIGDLVKIATAHEQRLDRVERNQS